MWDVEELTFLTISNWSKKKVWISKNTNSMYKIINYFLRTMIYNIYLFQIWTSRTGSTSSERLHCCHTHNPFYTKYFLSSILLNYDAKFAPNIMQICNNSTIKVPIRCHKWAGTKMYQCFVWYLLFRSWNSWRKICLFSKPR